MAKGSGAGRGVSGTRLRASDLRHRSAFLRRGLRGQDISGGLPFRSASFSHLRGGGTTSSALPVTVTVYPNGRAAVTDGRHRITVARERGDRTINAVVQGMGKRGGIRWTRRGSIKI